MVKHGIKGVIGGGVAIGSTNEKIATIWRDTLVQSGRDAEMGEDLMFTFSCHISETQEKAMNEAKTFFEENMKMFAPLGFIRGITKQQIESIADRQSVLSNELPTIKDAVNAGAWLCGPPNHIIEKLMEVQETYPGLQRINIGSPVGTPQSVIVEQLAWFAETVMPTFKNKQ